MSKLENKLIDIGYEFSDKVCGDKHYIKRYNHLVGLQISIYDEKVVEEQCCIKLLYCASLYEEETINDFNESLKNAFYQLQYDLKELKEYE